MIDSIADAVAIVVGLVCLAVAAVAMAAWWGMRHWKSRNVQA